MELQGQICRQRFTPDIIARIQESISHDNEITRTQLSRKICERLRWRSVSGGYAEVSCRQALLKLDKKGIIKLPKSRRQIGRYSENRSIFEIDNAVKIEGSVENIQGLELVNVDSSNNKLSRLWNHIVQKYHYLKSTKLCGAQQRYLIKCDKGWLGALSFSAAAWSLSSRDQFIGWDKQSQLKNLNLVVNNTKFILLPTVKVKNLSSKVLSMSIKRLPKDWLKRYGYSPVLLETFVDVEKYKGVSYQASNWQWVGHTKGRGRQDRLNNKDLSIKDIYIYPLCDDFRHILCDGKMSGQQTLPAPTVQRDWAEKEFQHVNFGDDRLNKRLITIVRDFYKQPQAAIPCASQSRCKSKAVYRFFDNAQVTMEKVLQSHYKSTIKRSQESKVVLALQDTTSLNYTHHKSTDGLGLIGSSKEGGPIGLIVHDTLAITPTGVPLGLLDVQVWKRDQKDFGKKELRKKLPIESKESMKWLTSYKSVSQAQQSSTGTRFVSVGDREADIYELFQLAKRESNQPELLVRAMHDRQLIDEQKISQCLENLSVSGIQALQVPRRRGQSARVAQLEIKYCEIALKPPGGKKSQGVLKLNIILANEKEAPLGVQPLRWVLLTTMEIQNFESAAEKLRWYARRWQIEVYHRTIKSGCKIEERQLGNANRIESCLAIDMVVAWRILHLTHLGRETPDVPCTVYFKENEWKALHSFFYKTRETPSEPPSLRAMTRMMAERLGGFLGRKSDGEPGTKSLWIALQRLDDIATTWKIFNECIPPP
jgi:hypothetical protein